MYPPYHQPASSSQMQQPTLQRVRIRSTRDAHQIFAAVARDVLCLITRRLDAEERRAIAPGNVYVWEERASTSSETTGLGMERWTDGMGWGPSRVRDEFLFYHQRDWDVDDAPSWGDSMRRREQRFLMHPMRSLYHLPFGRPTTEAERLIKQTYSVTVNLPADQAREIPRKWHLTAYFSQKELDSLRTVDDLPGVGDIPVPNGWFKSARASKTKREQRDTSNNGTSSSSPQPRLNVFGGSDDITSSQPDHYETGVVSSTCFQRMCQPSFQGPRSSDGRLTCREGLGDSSGSSWTCTPSLLDHLVPLEYLENVTMPRRNPTDEQVLSLFSKDVSPTHRRSHSHHAVSLESCTCRRRHFDDDSRSVF